MKKLLFLGLLLIPMKLEAIGTYYVIAATGSDSNDCTRLTPCVSSSRTASLMSPGDTTYIMTSAFGQYRASSNPYACIDTDNWGTLRARTSDYFYFIGQGTNTITRDCNQFIGLREGINWIWFQSMTFLNGTGAHAIQVAASSFTFADIYIKDGVLRDGQYNDVVAFESFEGVTSAKDGRWLRGLIAGRGKYMIKIGGSMGFAERNLIDGVVIRWDGIGSSNPSGDVSLYGQTGGVEGARNNIVRNIISIDDNGNNYHHGENHHGWYHPHSATDNKWISNIMVQCSTCASDTEGWLGGEDSAARNEIWNSVIWGNKKQPLFSNGCCVSSVTARNLTIYSKENAVDYHTSDRNYENIHRWFSNDPETGAKHGVVSLSSGGNAGDTNRAIFNFAAQSSNTIIITSPTIPGLIGTGIGGADRGARITSLAGNGMGTYSSTYSMLIHGSVPRFPIANEAAIMSVLCSSLTANPASPDATGNRRGACGGGKSLSWYILTQLQSTCPDGLCPETLTASESCLFTSIVSSFTIGGVTKSSFTTTWTGVGAVNYITVMDDNGDFSSVISSGSIAGATSGYINLNEGVTYYFKVKVASEPDCGYTTAISTWFRFNPQTNLAAAFSNVSTGSFNATWINSSANHNGVLATDSAFSNILTSGTISGGSTFYYTLAPETQYWFQVKVSSELFYNDSINTVTLALPKSSPNSHRRGHNIMRGRFK